MKTRGQIHLYTGHGKGKTTAALGLAMRAIGHGMSVYMVQFLKGGNYTGEYVVAENYLPNFKVDQVGKPCIKRSRQKTLLAYESSKERDIVVREAIDCGPCRFCFQVDEEDKNQTKKSFYYVESLVRSGFIPLQDMIKLLREKDPDVEVVLTGRDAPEELIAASDLVTDMREVRHYMHAGVMARPGIEY